jgi:DNA gyrase/topoisomerase IV subunit B
MADADPDGAHIRTLVLRLLFMYCRPLVEAGMVYAALPPLYGIPEKKNSYRFFTDKLDFVKYIQKEFSQKYQISYKNGKIMTQKDVTRFLYDNSDYKADLERVANTYAIHPMLLEDILRLRSQTPTKFKSAIEKKYRFLKCSRTNNITVIDGVAYERYHEVFVNDALINACRYVIPFIDKAEEYYMLNGTKASLYQIMCEFDRFMPPKLQRFKGLGEMDPHMLGPSTLRPDGNRLLIQYTVEDFEKEIQEMRYINSNKDLLLKD